MNEVGNFNIINTEKPSNTSINVVFSPSENIETYTYQVYKNDEKTYEFKTKHKAIIPLEDNGTYNINVIAISVDGKEQTIKSGPYIIDKEKPKISVKNANLKVISKNEKNIKQNAKALDNNDGDISNKIKISNFDLNTNKNQKITYTVSDSAGNTATKEINIKVVPNYSYFIIPIGLLITLLAVITYFIARYKRALNIEKRIEPFIVKPVKEDSLSISEKIIKKYQKITKKISKNFDKSDIAKRYSKKLEKYLPVTNIHKTKEDIFAGKIIVAFIFTILAIISKLVTFKLITGYEIVLTFTFGFFALDILYFIKYKLFRWQLESDFIAAITIMNNSFKSGRSITQAIDIVANELKGQMGEEFHRMSLELLYGLDIEVVFKRFAKRIDLEEANYLTASLTILNKTGGDIIKVFDSIERSMFDKRKLRLELTSLTSGSRIVVTTLLGMPFFFALVISLINKEYFVPLLTTTIGHILLIFMIIYYIIFVVVVRKVMKVVI